MNQNVYSVKGTEHGQIIQAFNEEEAISLFRESYEEEIVEIKKIG